MDTYRRLAARLADGALEPAALNDCLPSIPLSQAEVITLLVEAVERSHVNPREGWALATVVHHATRCSTGLVHSLSALALAETLINWEHFAQALQLLDDISSNPSTGHPVTLSPCHLVPLSPCPPVPPLSALPFFLSTSPAAACEWLRGLTLSRLARPIEAACALAQAGELLESQAGDESEAANQPSALRLRWQCDVARVKMMKANYGDALTLAQTSLDYFQAHQEPAVYAAQCQVVIAAIHFSQGNYSQALQNLMTAIAMFDAAGWVVERLRAQTIAAQIYERQMRLAETIALCKQLEPVLTNLDLPASLARCNNTLGLAHFNQGNLATATLYFERARDGFVRAHIHAFAADSELNLGAVFHKQGNFEAAIAQYQRASLLYQQHHHILQSSRCEHNIAQCYREMGDYSRALDGFTQAQAAFASLGARADLAICCHNLAFTYLLVGETERAADYLSQALAHYTEIGQSLYAAECYTELALITADRKLALAQLEQARQICIAADHAPGLALCNQVEGDILMRANRPELALDCYRRAAQTFERCGQRLDAALCHLGLATACFELGDIAQARSHLAGLAGILDERVPDLAWRVEALDSRLAEARGDDEAAFQAALRSVTYLSHARRSLADENLIHIFLNALLTVAASRVGVYERAIRLALQTGHPTEALQVIEEQRAQLLAGQLRWSSYTRPHADRSGRAAELMNRRLRLQAQISEMRSALQPGFSQVSPTAADAQLLSRLQTLIQEYEQVTLEARNVGWSALAAPRDLPPFSLDTFQQIMQRLWPVHGWSCLSYAWLGDELLILHLNDRGALNISRLSLSPLERQAMQMMSRPEPDWREAVYLETSPSAAAYRRRVYEILIPPAVQDELAPDRLLLIAPSGSLHSLPFAALQAGDVFLTQQALLTSTPSLQVMSLLGARQNSHSPPNRLLGVALTTFDGNIPPLPFVRDEMTGLLQAWQGEITLLENAGATREALVRLSEAGELLNYRFIHMATHAVFEAGRLARLLLHDGNLFVEDVRNLRMAAELVVLSACQTALGQVLSGDEIVGLAYSFLAAGAQAVIASLWHVNDPRTVALMKCLYSTLSQGCAPAQALASAQRSAIAEGWPPYFWASFILLGKT